MSGTNICSSVYTDPALTYVDLGWATFIPIANQAFAQAQSQISAVQGFEVPFQQWNASFDASGSLQPYIRPVRPEFVPITPPPNLTVPDAPSVNVPAVVLDPAPEEPSGLANPPVFNRPPAPDELDATRPGDAPVLVLPDMPAAPVLVDPGTPSLELIEIPDAPTFSILPFAEDAPVFNAAVPDETLNFVETPYASALLTRVREQVTAMIDGTYYLPAAVAQALWDQAVQREDQSALKLETEARDMHASRGFDEPNGVLDARLLEVKLANRGRRGELNREVYIRSEQIALENLRFAVQQGLALETTLLQAHLAVEQRKFELVLKSKDVALAVFQAHVTQFNAAVQAYNARVDAYRAYLDGLRAEVDVYRAMVEAAKVRGDINEQRVRMYAEEIRAQLARAEAYRAQVEGFKAYIDAERAKIDGYRAQVDAFRGIVEAHGAEWEAYRTRIQADAEQGKLYETLARVYGSRVDVWRTKGQAKFEEQKSHLAQAEAFLRQHDGKIRALLAQLEGSRTLISAQSAQNDAAARIYTAEAAVEQSVSDANARAFQAETERSRVRTELLLRDAEQQVQQLLGIKALLLEALKSSGQASSQLAASAFSALNFGASISSSQSRSKSCSTNFNYNGEPADAGA